MGAWPPPAHARLHSILRADSPIDELSYAALSLHSQAEEFDALEEDDQYTYLEELAPRMTKMHLQFLMGIIGFDDDEEEDFGEEVRACHG